MIRAYRVCGPWGTPLDIAERFYIAAATLGFLLIAAMPCSDELGQAASNLVRISCVTDTRPSARLGRAKSGAAPPRCEMKLGRAPANRLKLPLPHPTAAVVGNYRYDLISGPYNL